MNDKLKAIVDKVCAGATAAGEFATKTAATAGKKASGVINASKINLKIFDLTMDIEVLYKEVGRLIYMAHSNEETSAEELDARLLAIDEKNKEIEELRAALDAEKQTKKCELCGKQNERGAIYCSECGAKLGE